MTAIGGTVFLDCTFLESIIIPDSVTSIGASAFRNCTALTSINLSSSNPHLEIVDGVLFSKADHRIVCITPDFSATSYTVPEGIKIIDEYALYSRSLRSVTLPDSIVKIGNYAFYSSRFVTLTVPAGSYAEKWAKANGYTYVNP